MVFPPVLIQVSRVSVVKQSI